MRSATGEERHWKSARLTHLDRIHDDLETFHRKIVRIPQIVIVQMSENRLSTSEENQIKIQDVQSMITRLSDAPQNGFDDGVNGSVRSSADQISEHGFGDDCWMLLFSGTLCLT